MYSRFYGFSERPFDITPDPRFLYLSRSHREVLASLIYGIRERRGFIAVLGEAGTGKTTLLRSALDRLEEGVKVAHIFNTDVTFQEMLQMALVDLGIANRKEPLTKVEIFHRLNAFAIQQLSAGGNVVIMVDEAQNLDRNCLENLRLLSNLETRKHKLIQIVLSGQPELEEKLGRADLRQLSQRINLRRYIIPLNEQEIHEYVEQRLKVVGYSGPPILTRKAEKLLWQSSGGTPRVINTLCDNALLIAFAMKEKRIQEKTMKEAIEDLTQDRYGKAQAQITGARPHPATLPVSGANRRLSSLFVLVMMVPLIGMIAEGGLGLFEPSWKERDWVSSGSVIRSSISEKPSETPEPPPPQISAAASLDSTFETETPAPFAAPVLSYFPAETLPITEESERTTSAETAPQEEERWVIVSEGDSLHKIIFRSYGNYSKLLEQKVIEANPSIKNPNRIFVSQRLKMPEFGEGGK